MEVLKNRLYESFVGGTGLSFSKIFLILICAGIAGLYIFFVYRSFSKSAFYCKDMNVTLAGIVVVVAAIMVAMQSSLIVSLGMVGALSIVRFRTAIKNPLDLLYLFWAVSEGIICGVNLPALGFILCAGMTVLLAVLGCVPNSKAPAVIDIRCKADADTAAVENAVKQNSGFFRVASVSAGNGEKEIIIELKAKDSAALIAETEKVEGVLSVNYIEHTGELRG